MLRIRGFKDGPGLEGGAFMVDRVDDDALGGFVRAACVDGLVLVTDVEELSGGCPSRVKEPGTVFTWALQTGCTGYEASDATYACMDDALGALGEALLEHFGGNGPGQRKWIRELQDRIQANGPNLLMVTRLGDTGWAAVHSHSPVRGP